MKFSRSIKSAFQGGKAGKNRVKEFAKDPKKALIKISLPILVGMLVQGLYNIVDTAYVGRLGADSIAALTFSFPLFFILISLNMGIATGMSSRISRQLGAKQKRGAENTAIHGLLLSMLFSLVVTVLGLTFLRPIFSLLGADAVIDLATGYMRIVLIGSFFMFLSFVLSNILNAQGDTRTSMVIQICGFVLNMIIDPIFIFVLGYGVQGAAIATAISFFFSFLIASILVKKKSYLKISSKSFSFGWRIIKNILKVGVPAGLMMLFMSIYAMLINKLMASFGTEYVAAFGLDWRLKSLATMPMVAISISTMTLVGMFYGARRFDLLKKTVGYSIRTVFIWGISMASIFFLIPRIWVRLFTPDVHLIELTAAYLRIDVWMFMFMGVGLVIARAMQGMGEGMPGLIIVLVRTLIVSVPLAYIFVYILGYGYRSVAVSLLIAAILSAGIALLWWRIFLRKCRT